MVTAPIEKYVVKTMVDGTKFVTGGSLTIYYLDKPLPKEIHNLELASPLPFSSFTPCSIDANGNFVKDSRYKLQVTFDLYDANHNLQEQHKQANIHSAYVWSYSQTYPIAKIENADYSTIQSILGGEAVVKAFSQKPSPTDVEIKNFLAPLFTDDRLKKAMVSTYTYALLIGMTSSTGPDGVTMYYEYDSFGRLQYIKDDDGRILKSYEYHYKP
jgi:YD repeat-containing protein